MMPGQEDPIDERLRSLIEFAAISDNVIAETIGARIRMRALLELLEEKGIITADEYDERSQRVWERDFEDLAVELWEQTNG